MNNKKIILAALLLGMTGVVSAQQVYTGSSVETIQESAIKMVADGHYYAAKLSFERYLSGSAFDKKLVKDAEALTLVCDYALRTPGTADAIMAWLDRNSTSPYYDVLMTLRGNLLVMEERYEEVNDLEYTPFMYPASLLQEESKLYCAILAIHRSDYNKAQNLLSDLSDNEKFYIDCDYYLSYIKYVKGDFKGAYSGFSATSTSAKYKNTASLYAADCCVRTGNNKQALEYVNAVKDNGDNTEIINRVKGEAYFGLEQYSEAVKYFEKAKATDRTSLYKQGISYLRLKQNSKAADCLSKSAGTSKDVMAQSAWLNAGNAYLNSQKKRQAQIAFQQAANNTSDKTMAEEAAYNYALTLHDGAPMGFGESVTAFEGFLNKYPNSKYNSVITKHLTEVYFTTKNYSAALASIEKIKKPSKDILNAKQRVLYNLGIQSFTSADYKSAKTYMAKSIVMGNVDEESFCESYLIKGESEYRLEDYKGALVDLKQFTNIAPNSAKNYAYASYSIGYSYFKLQDYPNSLNHFQKYVNNPLYDGNEVNKPILADAYNRIGDCYMSRRNYTEANASYQKALDVSPVNGDYSLFQQAHIAGLRGQYDRKVELLNKMNDSYEGSVYTADALYEKGRAYVQAGKKTEASAAFSKIVNDYPQSANARKACNELAMIQYESGETDAAVKSYLKVIDNYPNTAEAQTALSNLKDVYVSQGKVNEYKSLSAKAGKPLSQDELETLLHDAAVKAVMNNDNVTAQKYYGQLKAQTTNESTRLEAQIGEVRAAYAARDYAATINLASDILTDGSKVAPEIQAEVRMARADSYLVQKQNKKAVDDLNILSKDTHVVYGAQATVRLAQYAYDTKQYESAENCLTNFIDSGTPHTYWLARAFILLSDVCARQGRDVEAQQYLISLKNNYDENEEINKMIEDRLK